MYVTGILHSHVLWQGSESARDKLGSKQASESGLIHQLISCRFTAAPATGNESCLQATWNMPKYPQMGGV